MKLADGITVHASGTRHMPKNGCKWPEVGLYFDSGWKLGSSPQGEYTQWQGPKVAEDLAPSLVPPDNCEYAVIRWPDYGVASGSIEDICNVFEHVLNRAGDGKFVDIGCIGAHGRTGTALAAMLILLGEVNANAAVYQIRDMYCKHAIESDRQIDWLWQIALHAHGDAAKQGFDAHEKKKLEKKTIKPVYGYTPSKKDEIEDAIEEVKDNELDQWFIDRAVDELHLEIQRTEPNEDELDDLFDDYAFMYGIDAQKLWDAYHADKEQPATSNGYCTWCDAPKDYCLCFVGAGY